MEKRYENLEKEELIALIQLMEEKIMLLESSLKLSSEIERRLNSKRLW